MAYPFDLDKLEALMESSEVSLLVVSSRHNVRYLTQGYYYHFHTYSDRMGTSRYISFVGIPRNRIGDSFFIGRKEEREPFRGARVWIPHFLESIRGVQPSVEALIKRILQLGLDKGSIAIEFPYFPADGFQILASQLPWITWVDATPLLNELRTIKRPEEQRIIRQAYSKVAQCITHTFHQCREGISTLEIEQILRKEMALEGVSFLFALICAGPGFSRAPTPLIPWKKGEILHIDAGGEIGDYVADICRMGSLGPPSSQAVALHAACLEVQNGVRALIRPGVPCGEVVSAGNRLASRYEFSSYARFVVHGIGMVPYEPPVCTPDSTRLLEAGMVLSIETDFLYPGVGHVKIEDAVLVTEKGCEGLGDAGREFQVI